MKSLLSRWFGSDSKQSKTTISSIPTPIAELDGKSFDIAVTAKWHEQIPHPSWRDVHTWVEGFEEKRRAAAFLACERAWLGMLARALGPAYRVFESDHALVLSGRPDNEAKAALEFVGASRRRVRRVLEELAGDDEGKEVLLSFTDRETYSRYAAYYCPDLDESLVSAGMFLRTGSDHFIVHGEELWRLEPTIVHELTHAQLAHLHLPLWVNEGMAVNTEERLTRRGAEASEVKAMEKKHAAFWTTQNIQQFWNGKAFKQDGDGSELAYDLGRLLVNGACQDWNAFKRFASAVSADDSGAQAAADFLDVDLGEAVRHFLKARDGEWGPRPDAWLEAVDVETE
jgi:hypothetical protein